MKIYRKDLLTMLSYRSATLESANFSLDSLSTHVSRVMEANPNLKWGVHKDARLKFVFGRNIKTIKDFIKALESNIPKSIAEDNREVKSIEATVESMPKVIFTDDMTLRTEALVKLVRATFLKPLNVAAISHMLVRDFVIQNDGLKYPVCSFKHHHYINYLHDVHFRSLANMHRIAKDTSMAKYVGVNAPALRILADGKTKEYIDFRIAAEELYEVASKTSLRHMAYPNVIYEDVMEGVVKDIELLNYKGKRTYA